MINCLSFNSEVLKVSHGFTGRGIATYPNGDVYEGPFVNGVISKYYNFHLIQVREGDDGTYRFFAKPNDDGIAPESHYKGQFAQNSMQGIGKAHYFGVGVYYGYFDGGLRNGEGVMTYTNQDIYSG